MSLEEGSINKNRSVLKSILVLIFLTIPAASLRPEILTIVHSNDTHGNYKPFRLSAQEGERLAGGMEAASHYLREIREREKNVLVIDTGDILTGTTAADLTYRGAVGGIMIEFLNRLGYDAWACGNHDFDRGIENAGRLAELARFPTLMANLMRKDNGPLPFVRPWQVFVRGSLRVGLVAVMEENFLTEVRRDAVESLEVKPMAETLKALLPQLERESDIVVVLAHSSFSEAERLARSVPGIDLILVASNDGRFEVVNGVPLQSTFGYQKTLGYIRLAVEGAKASVEERKLVWLWADIDLKPSSEVAALVKEADDSLDAEFSRVVGEARTDHLRSQYLQERGAVESPLGDWIADVMRLKTDAQIAFHNSGAIRADIKAGPVTKSAVFGVAPFRNTLVVFKLTGRQVRDVLERDVERGWDRLQVSGLRFRHLPREEGEPGRRVEEVEVGGETLVRGGELLLPDKVFNVVSNDYLVGVAEEKYFGFPVKDFVNTGQPLYEALVEWFEKFKVLDYRPQGRIVEIR